MRSSHSYSALVVAGLLLAGTTTLVTGCSCSEEVGTDDGGTRPDGQADPMDGDMPDTGGDIDSGDVDSGGDDGSVVLPDGRILLPDGAVEGCAPALCDGFLRLCGDCTDNDGDGLVDSQDPGCIGPCDNTEDRYDLDIRDTPACSRDCYYDNDMGSGNDGCSLNAQCDPLSPDAPTCVYDPAMACATVQPEACATNCGPLVPNGCDCFGCCELPFDSGQFVYLGGVGPDGERTCAPENIDDPAVCRACTPHPGCFNDCGPCELCLGRTELPADCFPPPLDGGPPPVDDAGNPIDAGPQPDAGTPPPRCDPGYQACGLPDDPACPDGYYCLTGCCIYFG